MESLEDKQLQLDTFGVDLFFPTFTIKGIDGQTISIVNFEVDAFSHDVITYYWQIKQEDWNNFEIANNDTFSTIIATQRFHWKIYQDPILDVFGWVKLVTNLITVVAL